MGIPSPIRWQAANARPAVAATVAMESADAPLAVKPILPNLDLDARCLLANQASASLTSKSHCGGFVKWKCASTVIQGGLGRSGVPVMVNLIGNRQIKPPLKSKKK